MLLALPPPVSSLPSIHRTSPVDGLNVRNLEVENPYSLKVASVDVCHTSLCSVSQSLIRSVTNARGCEQNVVIHGIHAVTSQSSWSTSHVRGITTWIRSLRTGLLRNTDERALLMP